MTALQQLRENFAGVLRAYPETELLNDVLSAAARPFDVVYALVKGTSGSDGATWAIWRDPDAVPVELLDWVAQHVGVHFDPAALEADKRRILRHPPGFDSAKTPTLASVVRETLTGSRMVRLLTIVDNDPWKNTLVTRTAETPDPAATYAAALTQKAAGVQLTHIMTDKPLIGDGTARIGDVTVTIGTATIEDVTA